MINSLVFNRSQKHVDRLKKLSAKGWNNLSAKEREEYRTYAAYGAYNYKDLNRVESAVAELSAELGLSLTTKTDWTVWDTPTTAEMERYLSNVTAIRDTCGIHEQLPSSMRRLNYIGANDIEYVLYEAYRIVFTSALGEAVLGKMILGA